MASAATTTLFDSRIEFCSAKTQWNGFAVDALTNFKQLSRPLVLTAAHWNSPACATLREVCSSLTYWFEDRAMDAVTFWSSEHLWQALKAHNADTFLRFTTTGDLGTLSLAFFERLYGGKMSKGVPVDPAEKRNTWAKKSMVGIVAKMAANPAHAKRLGMTPGDMCYKLEHLSPATEKRAWLAILRLKFEACPVARAQLMATQGRYLLEYDKSARRTAAMGKPPHWGGMVYQATLYGDNVMGRYLMMLRRELEIIFS